MCGFFGRGVGGSSILSIGRVRRVLQLVKLEWFEIGTFKIEYLLVVFITETPARIAAFVLRVDCLSVGIGVRDLER